MFLKKVEIINFGVYFGKNSLDFGRNLSAERKNIYLIGGLNGAGKTSLLKTITLGLLGKNTSHLSLSNSFLTHPQYKNILQDNFSKKALENGDKQMSIKLIFEVKGVELVIERKWWFDEKGFFADEDLNVFLNGAPLEIEKGVNLVEVKEEFIETKIPPQIAGFFFFDGEEIRKIAEKDPDDSIRKGLNNLLGFAMLERLLDDLNRTRDDIRKDTGKSPTKADLYQAESELSRKEDELEQIKDELKDKEREYIKQSEEYERVKMRISDITGGDDSTTSHKIEEQKSEFSKEISRIKGEIGRFVGDTLCVAMPKPLLNKLREQLEGELKRKEWEGKKNSLSPQKEKFINGLFGSSAPQPEPPLLSSQKEFLINRMEVEWNEMFNPPPDGMAENIIHTYFGEHDTRVVFEKIIELQDRTQQHLFTRIQKVNEIDRQMDHLTARQRRITTGPEFTELLEKSNKLSEERGKLELEIENFKRRIPPLENEISSLRQKCSKLEKELNISEHGRKLVETCKLLTETIEDFMKELRDKRIDGLSKKMTEMYNMLAHKKGVVKSITINPTTYKVIMKGHDGHELPEGSAGEEELFALSMIWGLTEISRRELPFIIDTPLARFDTRHRNNIVNYYFPKASKQVIILSQDTEIDEKWYEAIKPYIAKSFLLDFDSRTKTTSIVENRYFEFN